jgi:surface carbohydrate biosynthesis protein
LYCIEHVARELDIACAVRAIAQKKYGLNVHVHVLSNELDPVFEHHRPRLVAVPYCTSRQFFPRALLLRWPNLPILNLACEQLLSPGNRKYRLPRDEFARSQVLHVAAGEFFRRWLLESGVPPEHIVPAGSTTFQMYRDPYRRFYGTHRETLAARHGLDPNLPWVLFPENFGAAFFSKSHIRKRIRGGYARHELADYVDYAQRSFREIATWCGAAASTDHVEMIVRPRPAIARGVFARAFLDAAGKGPRRHLHFIKDGNVQQWILASQLVVSSYSTTLLEAAVAGKPAFLIAPFPAPESAASDWHPFAPCVSDQDAFLQLVRRAADESFAVGRASSSPLSASPQAGSLRHGTEPTARPRSPEHSLQPDRLREWADRNLLSHGDAIENVARVIAEVCWGSRTVPVPSLPPIGTALNESIRESLRRTERFLRQQLRPRRRRVFGHECDAVDQRAINKRSSLWAELLHDSVGVRAA